MPIHEDQEQDLDIDATTRPRREGCSLKPVSAGERRGQGPRGPAGKGAAEARNCYVRAVKPVQPRCHPGSAGQALAMEASDLSVPMVPGIYRRALAALPLKVLALGHQ